MPTLPSYHPCQELRGVTYRAWRVAHVTREGAATGALPSYHPIRRRYRCARCSRRWLGSTPTPNPDPNPNPNPKPNQVRALLKACHMLASNTKAFAILKEPCATRYLVIIHVT